MSLLLPGCPLLIHEKEVLFPFTRRSTIRGTSDTLKHSWIKKQAFLWRDLTALSFHDYTPPPSLTPNEWTGRQALAPSTGQQLKKGSTVEKWVIFSWHRNTYTDARTLALFTPTLIRAPLTAINWKKLLNVCCSHNIWSLHQGQQWKCVIWSASVCNVK